MKRKSLFDWFKSGGEILIWEDGKVIDKIKIEGNTFLHGFGQYILHLGGTFATNTSGTAKGGNLLINYNFETGDATGWTLSGPLVVNTTDTCYNYACTHLRPDTYGYGYATQSFSENYLSDFCEVSCIAGSPSATGYINHATNVRMRLYYTDGTYTQKDGSQGYCLTLSLTPASGKKIDYIYFTHNGAVTNARAIFDEVKVTVGKYGVDTALDGTANVAGFGLIELSCEAGSDTTTASTRDMTGVVSPFPTPIVTSDVTAGTGGDSNTEQNTLTWTANFPSSEERVVEVEKVEEER